MENRYSIIDNETGEIFKINISKSTPKNILQQKYKLLLKGEIDMISLTNEEVYEIGRMKDEINQFSQLQMIGADINLDFIKVWEEDRDLQWLIPKILRIVHNFTHILKRNHMTSISGFSDLWDFLEISHTDKKRRARLKRVCIENNLLREVSGTLILNPFLIRRAKHVGQVAIHAFRDLANENNMPMCSYWYAVKIGVIDHGNKIKW